ncbi:MAG: hypothetical protein JO015_14660 [Verrucomicrobia bacterium]|nr:hypothetical protein [Verrucomicrobiota bacterium]
MALLQKFQDLAGAHRLARQRAKLRRVLSKVAFEPAEKQPIRWHLFFDGERLTSALTFGDPAGPSVWKPGPDFSATGLSPSDFLLKCVTDLRSQQKGALELGIILHLADHFESGIVHEEYENPESFLEASKIICETPNRVVAGLSEATGRGSQWRYYPLLCGGKAIALNHVLDWLEALENLSGPGQDLKVSVRSAPAEMLAVLLAIYQAMTPERPHVLALFYDRFTVLAPLFRGLLNLSVLPHHGGTVPPNFGDDVFALLEPLGFLDGCNLVLVQCGSRDPGDLFESLQEYVQRHPRNTENLEVHVLAPAALWELCQNHAGTEFPDGLLVRPEFLVEEAPFRSKEAELSFSLDAHAEPGRWNYLARRNFWPADSATKQLRVSRPIASAMVILRFVNTGLAVALVLLLAGTAWMWWSGQQTPAARLNPQLAQHVQNDLATTQNTKAYLTKWGGVLTPRSQAWSVMDLGFGLVPPSDDIVCNSLKYNFKEVDTKEKSPSTAGWIREWTIEGMCDDRGSAYLQRLQDSSVLNDIFNQARQRLDDVSFLPGGGRTLKATYREEANTAYDSKKGDAFPYAFRLVVDQTVPADDPLALKPFATKKK